MGHAPGPVATQKSVSGPAAAEPQVTVVDFVCEADIRSAIKDSHKIYIGPRTIVTPSARDLAEASGVLVMMQR